jgi:hypothetical protein
MTAPHGWLPQFFPRPWEDEHDAFGIAFTEDIALGFVTREHGGYSCLLKTDARAQGSPPADLLLEALNNLAQMREGAELKIARPPGSTVAWVKAPDNFAAVRMLLPTVKSKLATELGDHYLFTVPSRDLCLFWTASSSAELSDKHALEAQEDYKSEEYNLSPHVYVYTDRWPCRRWK